MFNCDIHLNTQKNHGRKVNTQTYFGEGVTDSLKALSKGEIEIMMIGLVSRVQLT